MKIGGKIMKTSIIISATCVSIVAGLVVCLNRQKAPLTPARVAESISGQTTAQPEKVVISKEEPPQAVLLNAGEPAQVSVSTPDSDL